MQKGMGSRAIFLVYSSSVALCSVVILGGMLLSPSEPGSSIVLGLSLPRLIFAAGLMAAFVFFLALFLKSLTDEPWTAGISEQWFGEGRFSQITIWLAGISLGLGWIGCFLPSYRAGFLGSYWTRIQPLMVFILCAGAATLLMLLIRRVNFSIPDLIKSGIFRLAAILFCASLLFVAFMNVSKYGLYAPEDFWYGAGVPILTLQLIVVILAGALFLFFAKHPDQSRLDVAVFVLLFIVTAIVWAQEPLQRSFLFSEPRPPNNVLYPFADSAAFDAGSQFALIGQGIYIFNSPFNDRPLYLSLLVYLHSLLGQNFELLMAAQAALFAILPGLIYWIGRSLNMRAVGFAAGVMAMFRGLNSIEASSMIDLANPKMILSDFPAAIGVALIILFASEWLKQPEQKWSFAIWLGGAVGLTLMIRPHALVILVLLPFYAILRYAPYWKKWLVACTLIGLGVIAVTLPWEMRNVARGGIMYRSIVTKVQDVIRTRYSAPNESGSSTPAHKDPSALTFRTIETVSLLVQNTDSLQEQPCGSILCFAPKHFLHNTVTSILILPTSPVLHDLRNTVKGDQTYWRADWQGIFTPSAMIFLILNISFIVLGISVVWTYQGLSGLTPLAVFVIYNLANSFARTSGGRYIVPSDWIISLYFLAGVLFFVREIAVATLHKRLPFFDTETQGVSSTNAGYSPWRTTLLILSLLFAIGSVVPLSEKLHSPRYKDVDVRKTLQDQEARIEQAGLDMKQLDQFLQSPGAEILVGRTLYPRSYKLGQGETTFYFYPFTVMEFPRTGFFLIGPHGQDNILLPGGVPGYLPHGVDALVVGCREQNYVDAVMMAVTDENGAVYTRAPMPELTCPLKQPVCESNTVCE